MTIKQEHISPSPPPPVYQSPLKYTSQPPVINTQNEAMLNRVVTVDACYYYLSLIERFWNYMNTLSEQEQRLYLARAEYRYELWVTRYQNTMPCPPLDIAYVWHAHLLSPFRYFEDIELRLGKKRMYNALFPLKELHEHQIMYNGSEKSSLVNQTLKSWHSIFGMNEPYCLKKEELHEGYFQRKCWMCQDIIQIPWSDYADYRYGKNLNRIQHHCRPNGIQFFELAHIKLEYDMKRIGPYSDLGPPIAGTLLDTKGRIKNKGNKVIPFIKHISTIPQPNEMDYTYEVEIERVLKTLDQKYEYDANELMYAIRTCYQSNPTPFSIDLIHAVSRQKKFYESTNRIDWKPPKGFTSAIRRYHDFLILMKENPTMVAVPTIEIDCAWHTHMLFAKSYRVFTCAYLRRYINHDDTIPESSLKTSAVNTNSAWLDLKLYYRLVKWKKLGNKVEATMVPNKIAFSFEYYPGKVEVKEDDLKHMPTVLNEQIAKACKEGHSCVKISAHCHDIKNTFYRDDCDLEQLKTMQEFIGEGMKKTSYGYIGTISCGTGGKSAIYCDDTRSYSGKVITSYKNRWYKIGDPEKKPQNRFDDKKGSTCNSKDFVDVAPPGYVQDENRRRVDDITNSYYATQTAVYMTYPPFLYSPLVAAGCGNNTSGGFAYSCGSSGGCDGGGFSGCGGGGCGGGGCGGGGGGGGGCGGC